MDNQGDIWVGTEKGLNRLSKINEQGTLGLQSYLNPDGLGGNTVRKIILDRQNRLWLAGPTGVDIMDLARSESG